MGSHSFIYFESLRCSLEPVLYIAPGNAYGCHTGPTQEAQQQGYGTGGYAAEQGAAAASYGNVQPASGYASAQQAPTYTAPQPQQQPTAAGYGTAPSAGAGGYGTQQTTPALAGQSNVGQAQYGTLASPGPTQGYTSQQTSAATTYGQPPDARTSYTATQQTPAAPQAAYGRQGTARSYTQQAGQQQVDLPHEFIIRPCLLKPSPPAPIVNCTGS